MKRFTFLILALGFLNFGFAQSFNLNYEQDGKTTISANNGRQNLSNLTFTKVRNTTQIGYDLNGLGARRAKIQFYSNGRAVHGYMDNASNRGPLPSDLVVGDKKVIHTEFVSADDEWLGIILTAIALCCVEAHVGSDGWGVSFDCDCLGGMVAPPGGGTTVVVGETVLENVTSFSITPLDIETRILDSAVLVNR